MDKIVAKVIEYSLAAGADEQTFLKTSPALMPELGRLKGLSSVNFTKVKMADGGILSIGEAEKMQINQNWTSQTFLRV